LAPPIPSSLASIQPANPGSPGKISVKMEREKLGKTRIDPKHSDRIKYVKSVGEY